MFLYLFYFTSYFKFSVLIFQCSWVLHLQQMQLDQGDREQEVVMNNDSWGWTYQKRSLERGICVIQWLPACSHRAGTGSACGFEPSTC